GGLFDLDELVNAGVVHHDVQSPEVGDSRLDQRLDLCFLGDVRANRHGRSSGGFDIGNYLICTALARGVINDDLRAVGRELAGDACAYTLRSTRYDGDLVFQLAHFVIFQIRLTRNGS